jgi:hypothetical protein
MYLSFVDAPALGTCLGIWHSLLQFWARNYEPGGFTGAKRGEANHLEILMQGFMSRLKHALFRML